MKVTGVTVTEIEMIQPTDVLVSNEHDPRILLGHVILRGTIQYADRQPDKFEAELPEELRGQLRDLMLWAGRAVAHIASHSDLRARAKLPLTSH